jgi:hypothetical protein
MTMEMNMMFSNNKLVACLFLMAGVLLLPLSAAESSFGAHVGIDFDSTGSAVIRPGIDFRSVGGRGVLGTAFSVDYMNENARGYHETDDEAEDSELLLASFFGLAQMSMWYGDVALYAGIGTSYYYMPTVGGFSSLLEDQVLHLKTGYLFTVYPIQFFIEADMDLSFKDSFELRYQHPHVNIGASVLR